jgi:hypothetical protein
MLLKVRCDGLRRRPRLREVRPAGEARLNELMCSGLKTSEAEQLATLLQKIAAAQNLTPKVHPGYKDLKQDVKPPTGTRRANKPRKPQP